MVRLPITIASLACALFSLSAAEPRPQQPWGDLGDGRFANPILNGDYADADVERGNDRWYLITSTNHLSPGMTVLESKDLVNWLPVSHAVPSLDWDPRYCWKTMDGYRWGVWAGDLVRRKGEWACYWIDTQVGLLVTRAPDPAGPWSKPKLVRAAKGWTDPAVWFDDDTDKAWLVCNTGKDPASGMNELKLFRLSSCGLHLLDDGRPLFRGDGLEAAKIHRLGNRWYLFAAYWEGDGRTRDRVQICLRSKEEDIAGPYEKKVVFGRAGPGQPSACQGSLIQIPGEDRWYFLHQLVQNGKPNFHGRPLCLQPVTWREGWPVIGEDRDGDGKGEPVQVLAKPLVSPAPSPEPFLDTFDTEKPGPRWNWNHEPRSERFSFVTRPGWLRLTASRPLLHDARPEAFWNAPNTLSLRHLGTGDGEVSTVLDCGGFQPGTEAGLCHFSDRVSLIGVRMTAEGKLRVFARDASGVTEWATIPGGPVHLRTRWSGDSARSEWSLDRRLWTVAPRAHRFTFGHWRGVRHGLFCFNTQTDDPKASGHADFDEFTHVFQSR